MLTKAKKKEAEDFLREENNLSLKRSALYQKQLLDLKNVIALNTSTVVRNELSLRSECSK